MVYIKKKHFIIIKKNISLRQLSIRCVVDQQVTLVVSFIPDPVLLEQIVTRWPLQVLLIHLILTVNTTAFRMND